eukprot:GHUV01026769.1.p1 GENE.GHUV01026769.1~~GHUV01026769.1.p1  ORF type:complete len:491 (+),score=127.59 GHUV01026769.1:206-1678(+)
MRAPPPPQRPQHASDSNRHKQHQQHQQHQNHQQRPRPPGPPGKPAAGKQHHSSHHKAAPGKPGGSSHAAKAAPAAPVPAIAADQTEELLRLRRETPFICNIRFKNDLPEIPSDPKLLVSRYEPEQLSRFFLTSMEQQPRRELLLPADVGVTVSLMDLERHNVPADFSTQRPPLDPADEALLRDVNNLPTTGEKVSPLKVKRSAKGNVPWLMATTYMTGSGGPQEGRRLGGNANSRFQMGQQEELTREKQLQDIEGTFTAAAGVPRHPTKPQLKPRINLPIFPDFASWEDKYVTVNFEEGDPAQDSRTLAQVKDPQLRHSLISRCMIKSYKPGGATDEPAMGFLVPREAAAAAAAAAASGKHSMPDEVDAEGRCIEVPVEALEGDYMWDCEYSFELASKDPSKPPDVLLLKVHDDHVGYCQFDGQVKLKKRKRQAGDEPRPEKAVIMYRDFIEGELLERAGRQAELEPYDPANFEDAGLNGAEGLDDEEEY